MARGGFSVLVTALIAGVVGFGVGAYVTPTPEAAKFRALVDDKISAIKKAAKPSTDKTKVEPQAPPPAEETRKDVEPDNTVAPQGAESGCDPADPSCAGATHADTPPAPEAPKTDALEPKAPTESQNEPQTPNVPPEPAAAATSPTPPPPVQSAAPAVPAEVHAAPLVKKKPKPKPKPRPKPAAEPVEAPVPQQ